jgi:hypothetical protein
MFDNYGPSLKYVIKSKAGGAMEALGGREDIALLILDLGSRGGEWSASRPGRALLPGKGPPVPIVQEAGCTRAGLDTEATGKVLCLCRGSNPDGPVVQPVVRHYTD